MVTKIGDTAYTVGQVSNAVARTGDATKTLAQASEVVTEKTGGFWTWLSNFFKGLGPDNGDSGGE